MTTTFDIDVNSTLFWGIALAAIIVLNIVESTRAKNVAFAVINIAFLWLLLGPGVAAVLGAMGIFCLALYMMRGSHVAVPVVVLAGAAIFALFVANKLQGQVALFSRVGPILSLVGFSFMALRCADVMRAVYAGRAAPPKPLDLLNYLAPFHMLAAGPIAAFEDHARKPFDHVPLNASMVTGGVELIARGLFNKFVICYIIDGLFLTDFKSHGLWFVLELLMFTLWSYLDFSAYSSIALGIGRLAGVPTPINFRNPLMGRNLIDFWDRWHISLSTFVKNNVFMPIYIVLMRRGRAARPLFYASIATMIAFVLVGLWHGLTLGWFFWGTLHAVGLVVVRLYGHVLQQRLTPGALAAYRSSVPIRVISTAVTYSYIAFAFYPVALLSKVTQ